MSAEPIAANTAGQQRPTRASGTTVSVGASGAPKVAVTPVWSATRSGSQSTVTVVVARPSATRTAGRSAGLSTPAAMASTERIAAEASSTDTTGAPPSAVVAGRLNLISIQVPDSGRLRTTVSPPTTSRRAPVAWLVAVPFSCTCHCAGGAIRCTGLVAMRPAHSTSGASSTSASRPVTSASRAITRVGSAPEASTSSTAARSKRSSSSPIGSSTRVMPATAAVPGMMHT